ncbi:class E sortase [Amycolatopsis marina]|nr:class E sortase [Amycolatopsis marina]
MRPVRQERPERPERPVRRKEPGGADRPPPRRNRTAPPAQGGGGGGKGRIIVRSFGELLITAGLVVLLFVVYELYVTNLMSAELQREASAQLDDDWSQQRQLQSDLLEGEAFARIYIPSFGADYQFTVQEGVGSDSLEIGPGHYPDTAMPGEPGNVGIAGHRVGKGAPFNDLDLLKSCDAVVVETVQSFYVYRVLPMQDEIQGWESGKGIEPKCAGVPSLFDAAAPEGGDYGETYGRRIVLPGRGDAVAPVPYKPDSDRAKADQAALMTLTTCHPQFSDKERLIIHSVLTNEFQKQPGATYAGLLEKIGEA